MNALRIATALSGLGFGLGAIIVEAAPPSSSIPSAGVDAIGSSYELQESDDVIVSPDHTFFDPKYKVSGQVPNQWALRQTLRWGERETTLFFFDRSHPRTSPSLYYRIFPTPMQLSGTEIDPWLRNTTEQKAAMRKSGGLTDYQNGDVISRTIGGRPAVTWTAKYTRGGQVWMEYLTRIYSPNGTLLFFLNGPLNEMPVIIRELEPTIQATVLP